MSTTPDPRAATTGLVGGALWALLPLAWFFGNLDDAEFGTVGWVGVIAADWIFAVAAPALIVVGLTALRRALGDDAGRVGRVGIPVAGVGLGAMSLGMGIEVASATVGGGEVALGHAIFLIGFLVSIVGSLLLGIVVVRRRRDALSRAGGLVLTLALPLGIGIGFLGSALGSENDAWFFAVISVPTGLAWVLLGASMTTLPRTRADEPAPVA